MVRKRKSEPTPKKTCNTCGKSKAETFFFKVDSPLFPDGRINTCRDCIRAEIDVDDLEQVIGFLRQIDKPFYQDEWEVSLENRNKRHPIGSYLSKVGSLPQYKGKTFKDSDGVDKQANDIVDLSSVQTPDSIETNNGKIIVYSDNLVDKWDTGYTKKEYLQLEKFYQDMKASYEIYTPTHIDMLKQLSYLSIDRDRLRREKDWNSYNRVSQTYEKMMDSSGFKPSDRKGMDELTGIRSFSQVWEQVEKRGFRKPPTPTFDEDIIDGMITSIANYYHRLIGKEIVTEIPEEIKKEMDEFYKENLEPDEIQPELLEEDFVEVNRSEDNE